MGLISLRILSWLRVTPAWASFQFEVAIPAFS